MNNQLCFRTEYRVGGRAFCSHIWAPTRSEAFYLAKKRGLGEKIICALDIEKSRHPRLADLFKEKKYVQAAHGVTFFLSILIHSEPAYCAAAMLDNGVLHELLHKAEFGTFSIYKRAAAFARELTQLEQMVPGYLPVK
jgi:hypothetical protein